MSRLRRSFAGMPGADRAAWAALVVVALVAAVLIATQDSGETPAVRAPAPETGASTEPAQAPVTVDAAKPLLLGDTAVRALRATRSGREVTVTLRVRNTTGRTQRLDAGGFALALDGVEPRPLPATAVADGESVTARPRFAVGGGQGGRAELEVTGWDGSGTGTIRLEVDGA